MTEKEKCLQAHYEEKRDKALEIIEGCGAKMFTLATFFDSVSRDECTIEPIVFGAGMHALLLDMNKQLYEAGSIISEIPIKTE